MKTINEHMDDIDRCAYMIKRTSKYPVPKHNNTYWRRRIRTFRYAVSIKASIDQIQTILARDLEGLTLFANED